MSVLVVGLVGVISCRGGCARDRPEARPLGGRLALFPIETQLVVALDIAQVRPTPVAARLAALAAGATADQRQLDAFKERTGFDPLQQIDRVMIGLPDEARRQGEIGVVIRASHLDERRLVAYLLQAFAATSAPPLPDPPSPAQTYRALLRVSPKGAR